MNDLIIERLFISYFYNRTNSYMIELCEEVNKRVCGYHCSHTDDGDIIYGFIVLMYGDYGASPRSGWLSSEYRKDISKCIDKLIEKYKEMEDVDNEE